MELCCSEFLRSLVASTPQILTASVAELSQELDLQQRFLLAVARTGEKCQACCRFVRIVVLTGHVNFSTFDRDPDRFLIHPQGGGG